MSNIKSFPGAPFFDHSSSPATSYRCASNVKATVDFTVKVVQVSPLFRMFGFAYTFPSVIAWFEDCTITPRVITCSPPLPSSICTSTSYRPFVTIETVFPNAPDRVYLFLGGPQGPFPASSFEVEGENDGDRFGAYVANACDVNGDGYQDLLVGAPDNSEKGYRSGKVYLFYGGKNGKLNRTP